MSLWPSFWKRSNRAGGPERPALVAENVAARPGVVILNVGCPSNTPSMQTYGRHSTSVRPEIRRPPAFVGVRLSSKVADVLGRLIEAVTINVLVFKSV